MICPANIQWSIFSVRDNPSIADAYLEHGCLDAARQSGTLNHIERAFTSQQAHGRAVDYKQQAGCWERPLHSLQIFCSDVWARQGALCLPAYSLKLLRGDLDQVHKPHACEMNTHFAFYNRQGRPSHMSAINLRS